MIKHTQSRVGFQLVLWKFIWFLGKVPKFQALCALCWASFPVPAALGASLAQGFAESILVSGHLWMGTKLWDWHLPAKGNCQSFHQHSPETLSGALQDARAGSLPTCQL